MRLGTPPAELEIGAALVRRLLGAQHPDLAALPLGAVQEGWDNVTMRLGTDLAVRLPRRRAAADLVRREQIWLPQLAPALPVAVPVACRIGLPGADYPWHWSVLPWLAGETADRAAPAPEAALHLAAILHALHQAAPPEAPHNPFRAEQLSARAAGMEARLQRLAQRGRGVGAGLGTLWARAMAAAVPPGRCWIHGDLHARNVLVDRGRIAALIDWGDLTAGDVAVDLAGFWMLFDEPAARRAGLARYGAGQGAILRAMGWAMAMAVVHLDSGLEDHPAHAANGAAVLARLDADLRAGLI